MDRNSPVPSTTSLKRRAYATPLAISQPFQIWVPLKPFVKCHLVCQPFILRFLACCWRSITELNGPLFWPSTIVQSINLRFSISTFPRTTFKYYSPWNRQVWFYLCVPECMGPDRKPSVELVRKRTWRIIHVSTDDCRWLSRDTDLTKVKCDTPRQNV